MQLIRTIFFDFKVEHKIVLRFFVPCYKLVRGSTNTPYATDLFKRTEIVYTYTLDFVLHEVVRAIALFTSNTEIQFGNFSDTLCVIRVKK